MWIVISSNVGARALQPGCGIEADATPRHARGVWTKAKTKADYQIAQDRGIESQNRYEAMKYAYREVHDLTAKPRSKPWEQAIASKHDAVKETYRAAASDLKQSPDAKECEIGQRLERFVDEIRGPTTRERRMQHYCRQEPERAAAQLEQLGAKYGDPDRVVAVRAGKEHARAQDRNGPDR